MDSKIPMEVRETLTRNFQAFNAALESMQESFSSLRLSHLISI